MMSARNKNYRGQVEGRRHSRWLTMMYSRLVLARNLLAQDGSKLVCEVSGTCLTRRLLRFVRNSPRTNGILTRECVGLKRSAMD